MMHSVSTKDRQNQQQVQNTLTTLTNRQANNNGTSTGTGTLLLADLPTPAFVVNRHAFAKNCQTVLDLAKARSLKLRPHIKTHKTRQGVYLQQHGTSAPAAAAEAEADSDSDIASSSGLVTGFVASTIPEVELLVEQFQSNSDSNSNSSTLSILYGVPISANKLPALAALRKKLHGNKPQHKIHILIDHPQQIEMVNDFVEQQQQQTYPGQAEWSGFVKLDTGYHRAGTTCDEHGMALVETITQSSVLKLAGIYSHCGHAYDIHDQDTISKIAKTDMDLIQQFMERLEHRFPTSVFDNLTLSVGSTPSLWHHFNPAAAAAAAAGTDNDDKHGVNSKQQHEWWAAFVQRHPSVVLEIHPGNYTFFDRQQLYSGAATAESSLAARVLTRVIGHYNDEHRPQTILLDAGATALTKEATPQGGMAAIASSRTPSLTSPGYNGRDMVVYKMSQEVSMARPGYLLDNPSCEQQKQSALEAFPLGSILSLLPNHSCLAAACFDKYYIIDDPSCQFDPQTPILEEWIPVKGW